MFLRFFKSRYFYLYIILFATVLAIIYACNHLLIEDESYYWAWSRHLGLSYYDGPPLTSYLIRLSTLFFGQTVFAVKWVSILCTTLTCLVVIRLATRMFDLSLAAYLVITLVLTPFIQIYFIFTSLTPALLLFWSIAIYCFYRASAENSNGYRILTGMALGFALLAKYTAILLPVAFLIYCLLDRTKRNEFKNIYWYISAIIAILIFSPVLIWNAQHHWLSFVYQSHHGIGDHFSFANLGAFFGAQILMANPIFFFSLLFFIIRHAKKIWQDSNLLLLAVTFVFPFLFFFYNGLFKTTLPQWAVPSYISALILFTVFIFRGRHYILFSINTLFNLLMFTILFFPSAIPHIPGRIVSNTASSGYRALVQQAEDLYQPSNIIISDNFINASLLSFYLPNHPQTYVLQKKLDITQLYGANQYYFWSKPILKKVLAHEITTALYIGQEDHIEQMCQFFNHIVFLKTLSYQGRWIARNWVVYRLSHDNGQKQCHISRPSYVNSNNFFSRKFL